MTRQISLFLRSELVRDLRLSHCRFPLTFGGRCCVRSAQIRLAGSSTEGPHEVHCVCRKPCHSCAVRCRALRPPNNWSKERPTQRTFSTTVWVTICSGSVRLRKSTRTTSRSSSYVELQLRQMTEARSRSRLYTRVSYTSPTTTRRWRLTPKPASKSGRPRSSTRQRRRVLLAAASSTGAPALFDGKLFRTTLDAHVIALDAKTGKELWPPEGG